MITIWGFSDPYFRITQISPVQRLGGGGCNKFVPVFGGDGTKIAPTGNIFDHPPGGMISIRGKFADHVGDHVVLFPKGTVLVTSPGTESSYSRPPQSLNDVSQPFSIVE